MCSPGFSGVAGIAAGLAAYESNKRQNEAEMEFNKQQLEAKQKWPEFEVKQCEGCGGRKSEYKNGVKVCAYCGGEK